MIAILYQNSPTVEFWWEKIEGSQRRANTELSIDFRRANAETSVDFRKANTETGSVLENIPHLYWDFISQYTPSKGGPIRKNITQLMEQY